jgi:hypothetical protein
MQGLLSAAGRANVSLVVRSERGRSGAVTSAAGKAISARQAAVLVLREAGEPLKSAEVARRVLAVSGVRLAGRTPEATVAAKLAVENKRPDGLFVRVAPGTYGLREP